MTMEEAFRRLESVEKHSGLAEVVENLKDALIVTAEVQRRQADIQKQQAERIEEHERLMEEHRQRMRHIDATLAEIGDKLNGLIGYVDNMPRKPPENPKP